MGATVEDVRGEEGFGLKTWGWLFAERLVGMRAGRRCVPLGGRPGRAQDGIGLWSGQMEAAWSVLQE